MTPGHPARLQVAREDYESPHLDYGAAYYPHFQCRFKVPLARSDSGVDGVLKASRLILPPSAAVAGIFARVDATRGVWKAPANVSLSAVIRPAVKIDDALQESPTTGTSGNKPINPTRAFTGKGVLLWGARTLAGDSLDWRYVNVRRLFIQVRESLYKSLQFVVFEPNEASTWARLNAMAGNYLVTK